MATTISNGESGSSVRTKLNNIWEGLQINEIASTIADTAVDIFVYDTRKDSDGGAWRKRTQHTSWYNETLNTATRGSRKEFPAVAVIVAESGTVTIYDGDDPDLPMWRVTNAITGVTPQFWRTGRAARSTYAINGRVAIGLGTDGAAGLAMIDFAADLLIRWSDGGTADGILSGVSNDTSVTATLSGTLPALVNNSVNDVAMTVLPNAPIDAATGLPVPTIAVATDGGVSVIKDDGTVVDDTTFSPINTVTFGIDNDVFYGRNAFGRVYKWDYSADTSSTATYVTNATNPPIAGNTNGGIVDFGNDEYWASGGTTDGFNVFAENKLAANITSDFNTGWMNGDIKLATLSDTDDTNVTGSELVTNGAGEFTGSDGTDVYTTYSEWSNQYNSTFTIQGNKGRLTPSSGFPAAQLTVSGLTSGKVYTVSAEFQASVSGKNVDIESSTVASDTTLQNISHTFTATSSSKTLSFRYDHNAGYVDWDNISVRLAEEDRSVNDNGLQVFGTVTKSAVATGADLVAYSGFSGSNYLEQPYNSDLDFGTGDFCINVWNECKSAGTESIFARQSPSGSNYGTGSYIYLATYLGKAYLKTSGGTIINQGSDMNGTGWNFITAIRQSGILKLFVNGELIGSASDSSDLDNTEAVGRIGILSYNSSLVDVHDGEIALLRISATAPSPEQILKIYNDEKHLFTEGAQATLYGSSDSVTALAYDTDSELLHVGTSAGRSVFQGLRRVDNTTTAVGAAISASNGLVADE